MEATEFVPRLSVRLIHDVDNAHFGDHKGHHINAVGIYKQVLQKACALFRVSPQNVHVHLELVLSPKDAERVTQLGEIISQIEPLKKQACNWTCIVHNMEGAADVTIKRQLDSIREIAVPETTLVVLISSDRAFLKDIQQLRRSGFRTMVIHERGRSHAFVELYADKAIANWRSICEDHTNAEVFTPQLTMRRRLGQVLARGEEVVTRERDSLTHTVTQKQAEQKHGRENMVINRSQATHEYGNRLTYPQKGRARVLNMNCRWRNSLPHARCTLGPNLIKSLLSSKPGMLLIDRLCEVALHEELCQSLRADMVFSANATLSPVVQTIPSKRQPRSPQYFLHICGQICPTLEAPQTWVRQRTTERMNERDSCISLKLWPYFRGDPRVLNQHAPLPPPHDLHLPRQKYMRGQYLCFLHRDALIAFLETQTTDQYNTRVVEVDYAYGFGDEVEEQGWRENVPFLFSYCNVLRDRLQSDIIEGILRCLPSDAYVALPGVLEYTQHGNNLLDVLRGEDRAVARSQVMTPSGYLRHASPLSEHLSARECKMFLM